MLPIQLPPVQHVPSLPMTQLKNWVMTRRCFRKLTSSSTEPTRNWSVQDTVALRHLQTPPAAYLLRSPFTYFEIAHPPVASSQIKAGTFTDVVKTDEISELGAASLLRRCAFCL